MINNNSELRIYKVECKGTSKMWECVSKMLSYIMTWEKGTNSKVAFLQRLKYMQRAKNDGSSVYSLY